MKTLKHIWFCWIKGCEYYPHSSSLTIQALRSHHRIVHSDTGGYYAERPKSMYKRSAIGVVSIFVKHLAFCFLGCTVVHLADAYFGYTRWLFRLLGIGF